MDILFLALWRPWKLVSVTGKESSRLLSISHLGFHGHWYLQLPLPADLLAAFWAFPPSIQYYYYK